MKENCKNCEKLKNQIKNLEKLNEEKDKLISMFKKNIAGYEKMINEYLEASNV